jgi:hypothetical protein
MTRLGFVYTQGQAEKSLPLGGGRPFGYEAAAITIRDDEAKIVRELTERVLAGGSLASLIRDLNIRGITSTWSNPWRYSNSVAGSSGQERRAVRVPWSDHRPAGFFGPGAYVRNPRDLADLRRLSRASETSSRRLSNRCP